MMIKFLAHGTGSAAKAADYLTSTEKQAVGSTCMSWRREWILRPARA